MSWRLDRVGTVGCVSQLGFGVADSSNYSLKSVLQQYMFIKLSKGLLGEGGRESLSNVFSFVFSHPFLG